MKLVLRIKIISLFLLCFCTVLEAQTLDSWLINQFYSAYSGWDENINSSEKLSLKSESLELETLLNDLFINKGYTLVHAGDSTVITLEINTQGRFIRKGKTVFADGVFLIKKFKNEQMLASRRFVIQEQTENSDDQKSRLWSFADEETSSESIFQWLEPALILSAMALTVYLLFAVRS